MYQLALIGSWTVFCLIITLYGGDFYKHTGIALLRLPFFVAGCFYGRSSYEHRETYWKWAVLLVFSAGLNMLLPANTKILFRYLPGAINLSLCAFAAVLFTSKRLKLAARIFTWFGNHSLELYLTHVTVRKFMKECGYFTCYFRYETVMAVLSIFLAWLLSLLSRNLSKILQNFHLHFGNKMDKK
jgi:peptidoglycan/LPS O-acetylase OafA/YrhL